MSKNKQKEEDTSYLMEVLENVKGVGLEEYKKKHLEGKSTDFISYMDNIIDEKNIIKKDLFKKADLPEKYGYKLLTKESPTRNRDALLRIFIALNMTVKQANRALALYELPNLYPKNKRDIVIIAALNDGISDVDKVDKRLAKEGESKLKRSGKDE